MKRIVILCMIIVGFCCFAFSQGSFFDNYVYQSWNSFGTLNGTTITDILQTKDGYINIGVAQPDVAPVRDFAEHRRIAGSTDCAARRAYQLYAEIVPNTMPAIMTAAQKSL